MRTAVLLTGYRRFAAQTRLAMALLAVALLAAIGVMVVAGAQAANAAFLDAEARNFATLSGSDDSLLVIVVGLVFLAAFAAFSFGLERSRARPKKGAGPMDLPL